MSNTNTNTIATNIKVKEAKLDDCIYNATLIKNMLSDYNDLDPDEMDERDIAKYLNRF